MTMVASEADEVRETIIAMIRAPVRCLELRTETISSQKRKNGSNQALQPTPSNRAWTVSAPMEPTGFLSTGLLVMNLLWDGW